MLLIQRSIQNVHNAIHTGNCCKNALKKLSMSYFTHFSVPLLIWNAEASLKKSPIYGTCLHSFLNRNWYPITHYTRILPQDYENAKDE